MTSENSFICTDPVRIGENIKFGKNVVFDGPNTSVDDDCRIDSGCIIGENVKIGKGAWARAGSVILKSVPANAIVEGNPAQVVGYREHVGATSPKTKLIDAQHYVGHERPTRLRLDVGESSLHLLKHVVDVRGSLSVGEAPSDIPFLPKRYFVVYDVPSSELRGEHAHINCKQFLICLRGQVRVLLDNGINRCEVILNNPHSGVYMPEMIWGTQYNYSNDAILLVFASDLYDPHDYIRTYDQYLTILEKKKIGAN